VYEGLGGIGWDWDGLGRTDVGGLVIDWERRENNAWTFALLCFVLF
jgi:hypothetical protein